jgi:hypothetical protein
MGLSPSWGAANCAATQKFPTILRNPNIQYRIHKSPPLVPIVSHIHPIHSIPFYLSKIHFTIVRPPTSRWSQWSALPPKSYMHSSSPPFVQHAQLISSFLIWSFWLYLETCTSYEAPCYAVFSSLLSLHPHITVPSSKPLSLCYFSYAYAVKEMNAELERKFLGRLGTRIVV